MAYAQHAFVGGGSLQVDDDSETLVASARLALADIALRYIRDRANPPGTVLPVMLNSTLDARRDKPGRRISGKVMQDVTLPDGKTIPRGSRIVGHVVSARPAATGTPSQMTIHFDEVDAKHARMPITAQLRALASMNEVYESPMPTNAWDDYGTSPSDWNTIQIGGAGVYRGNGEVVRGSEVVGRATDYGAVTAKLLAAPERGCAASSDREQALWKFSPWACGTYGLGDLQILRPKAADPGEIVLQSARNIRIGGGSGWLLRVQPAADRPQP